MREVCGGCGATAATHPMVAVMSRTDATKAGLAQLAVVGPRGFVPVPVCARCHADPSHRVVPLKAHFFPRDQGPAGAWAASANLDGRGVGG